MGWFLIFLVFISLGGAILWRFYRESEGREAAFPATERLRERMERVLHWVQQNRFFLLVVAAIILTIHLGIITRWMAAGREIGPPESTAWFWEWLWRFCWWLVYLGTWLAAIIALIAFLYRRIRRYFSLD